MRRLFLLSVLALAGCVVVVDGDGTRRTTNTNTTRTNPPAPPPTVAWVDCRTVIYREYFECDWEWIGAVEYYQAEYAYDDDDLFVLCFIARHARVDLHEVIVVYEQCNWELFSVALRFRMTGDEFFIPVDHRTRCPGPYGRAYGFYWNRQRNYVLTNHECRLLLHLRIGVHYYGFGPEEWFDRWERQGVQDIYVKEHARCGQGRKAWSERAITAKMERPWVSKAEQDKAAKQRADARQSCHREIEARQQAGKPVPQARATDARREAIKRREDDEKRREDEERAKRREDDRRREDERKKDEERRKKDDEEARRRAAEDARRRDDEARRAEEDRRKAEEDARRADDARRRAEEEARKREAEEARRRAEEDARREEARRKAEEETRKRAEEEARNRGDAERHGKCRRLIDDLAAAIAKYHKDHKKYPDSLSRLSDRGKDGRPYHVFARENLNARGEVVDAWGRGVLYKVHAPNFPKNRDDKKARNKDSFDLCSHGADGRDDDGAGDDVANWNDRTEEDARRKCDDEVRRQDDERKRKEKEERDRKDKEEREKKDREKKEQEERARAEEAARRADEERRKKEADDARRKAQEEARKKAEDDARKKADEDRRKKDEEARRKAEEEAARKADEDRRKKEADDARRKAEEEARKRAEDDARRKAEADAARKAEEERKKKEADDARKKAEEEARKKADEERKKKESEGKGDAEKATKAQELVDTIAAAIEKMAEATAPKTAQPAERLAHKYPDCDNPSLVKLLSARTGKPPRPWHPFRAEELDKDNRLIDPWGNPLVYKQHAKNWPKNKDDKTVHNKQGFDLYSCGPNGKDDGGEADDIGNWKR